MKHQQAHLVLAACGTLLAVACGTTNIDFGTGGTPGLDASSGTGSTGGQDASATTDANMVQSEDATATDAAVPPPACGIGTEPSGMMVNVGDNIEGKPSFAFSQDCQYMYIARSGFVDRCSAVLGLSGPCTTQSLASFQAGVSFDPAWQLALSGNTLYVAGTVGSPTTVLLSMPADFSSPPVELARLPDEPLNQLKVWGTRPILHTTLFGSPRGSRWSYYEPTGGGLPRCSAA